MSSVILERLSSPLAAAREESVRGRRVVGYIGDDIPVELILAAGALPLRLSGVPRSTPKADRYLESSFGPAARSLLEAWLAGELDFLDAIVFPRSNDTAQRLYYYICELQRRGVRQGPQALIYDLARVNRDTSHAHTVAATRTLAAQLETSTARLGPAISRMTTRASLVRKLAAMRLESSAPSGADVLRLWCALQWDWSDAFERAACDSLASLPRMSGAKQILLAGSTPPDERLHAAIERAGGNVADEFFDEAPAHAALRWSSPRDSIESIAEAYRTARSTAAALLQNPDVLVERARAASATGVILWFVEQDEGIVWEVPRQLERLRRAGIQTLSLTRQAWDADTSCLAAIETFVRSLQETP